MGSITGRHFFEGLRIARHAIKRRFSGPRRYEGDALAICRAVVDGCWCEKQQYFRTSRGNYPEFYARDFGMCVDALLSIGMRDKVRATLVYALNRYRAHGRFRLAISASGKPFDFPNVPSPDGFAFFLHGLAALDDTQLIADNRDFLQTELDRFVRDVVDPTSGIIKPNLHVSGMRDYAIRDSSCYDNVAVAAIARLSMELGLDSVLASRDYEDLIIRHFWNGEYFIDDHKSDAFTGDANIAPFWFRVINDVQLERDMFRKVLDRIIAENLEQPLPLRYEHGRNSERAMLWIDTMTGSWELDKVWMHLGNLFLQVLARYDKDVARHYLERHQGLIERERNYPEVLDKEGRLHKSLLFHSDCSMLWAANYISLSHALESSPGQ